jgi:hypothetical protein
MPNCRYDELEPGTQSSRCTHTVLDVQVPDIDTVAFELNLSCSDGMGCSGLDHSYTSGYDLSDRWATPGRWGQIDGLQNGGLYLRARGVQFVTLHPTHFLCQRPQLRNLYIYFNYLRGFGYDITVDDSSLDAGFATRARAVIAVPRILSLAMITTGSTAPHIRPPTVPSDAVTVHRQRNRLAVSKMSPTNWLVPQLIAQYETDQDHGRRAAGLNAKVQFQLGIRACLVHEDGYLDEGGDVSLCNGGKMGWMRLFDGFLPGSGMFLVNHFGEIEYASRPDTLCDDEEPVDCPVLPSILGSVNVLRALGYIVTITCRDDGRPTRASAELMVPRWRLLEVLSLNMELFDNW